MENPGAGQDGCHIIVQTHSHHRTTLSSPTAEVVNSHHCDEEPRRLIREEGVLQTVRGFVFHK